jgi:phosphoribosylformylglycinamidine synthase
MAMASGLGFDFGAQGEHSTPGFLFGEEQGRYLLAVDANIVMDVCELASRAGIPTTAIGNFGGESIHGMFSNGNEADIPLSTLRAAHEGWLPNYMKGA